MKLVNKSAYALELSGDELRMLREIVGNHSRSSHEEAGVSTATANWSGDVLYPLLNGVD